MVTCVVVAHTITVLDSDYYGLHNERKRKRRMNGIEMTVGIRIDRRGRVSWMNGREWMVGRGVDERISCKN